MKCPYCGTDNPDAEDFCSNCGGYLKSSPAATVISSMIPTAGASTSGSIPTTTGGSTIISRSLTPGGTLQNGRYVIKKVLGQGGMGAALLASDMRVAGKQVVIKELISDNTDPTKRQEDVRNFEREMQTLAVIDHPLVPNVTDHFQEGTHYFMVQEYVDGENLEDRMKRVNRPMPEPEALNYTSQVLDILDYLSQQNPPIVHRDIKPANIIIGTRDKRAHLVDFGIARADIAKNAKRKQTSALGTQGYAPPEQYQGNADGRSDLYALAATLHYLLTNRDPSEFPPFAFPPVRSLNSQLSPDIERVLNRELTIDINKRYQTAAAMKQDIDNILLNRFHVSGNLSTYTLGTSGPLTVPNTTTTPNKPASTRQPASRPPSPPPPPPPLQRPLSSQPNPFAPVGARGPQVQQQPRQQGGNNIGRIFILFIIVILLIFGVAAYTFSHISKPTSSTTSTPGSTATPLPSSANGIGVTKAPDGEYIGISDGTFAFDTNRPDGRFKTQAAQKLMAGDIGGAQSLWQSGLATDTNDAEALIYQQDQQVLASGNPYITFVVGTMMTGDNVGVGRDDLQGAYVAQKIAQQCAGPAAHRKRWQRCHLRY